MRYITRPCSGCHEEEIDQANYKWDAQNGIYLGNGCRECGYTGKSRIPITNRCSRVAKSATGKAQTLEGLRNE